MLKVLLNLILNVVLGKLKPVLLKHIETLEYQNLTNEEKRKAVLSAFTSDLKEAGKEMGETIKEIVFRSAVALVKDKLK